MKTVFIFPLLAVLIMASCRGNENQDKTWRISDRFWHKGYATEAAKACIKYARQKRFCDRLYSFTAVPNIPSENVMKRIGMSCQGTFMHPALPAGHWLKEHKLYSIEL